VRVCMYVNACMCVCVNACMCVHVYMHVYAHVCVCVHVCVYVCMCIVYVIWDGALCESVIKPSMPIVYTGPGYRHCDLIVLSSTCNATSIRGYRHSTLSARGQLEWLVGDLFKNNMEELCSCLGHPVRASIEQPEPRATKVPAEPFVEPAVSAWACGQVTALRRV